MRDNKGSVLVIALMTTVTLLVIGYAMSVRSMANLKVAHTSVALSDALYSADGGVDGAITKLNDPTLGLWNSCDVSYANSLGGEYVVRCPESNLRKITSFGDVNAIDNRAVTRVVEVYGTRLAPNNFYGNAIYATNGIEFNGNSYQVVGDVVTGYTGTIDNTGNVQGDILQDVNYAPLPEIDLELLKQIAVNQGNYFDSWTIKFRELPTTFWYAPGVANVVYIDDAGLTLRGNDVVGGFIVLADETLESPIIMKGNATIEGVVYTKGDFAVDGGGHSLNINGGVFSGDMFVLNGGIDIQANQAYADAIQNLNPTTGFSILSWRELRGDPKTLYDQDGNRCHSSEQNCPVELSGWNLIAYGVSSKDNKFVTYRNPENEREVVQVFYDTTVDGNQVTGIDERTYSKIDGSVDIEDGSQVYAAAATYTEAGGL